MEINAMFTEEEQKWLLYLEEHYPEYTCRHCMATELGYDCCKYWEDGKLNCCNGGRIQSEIIGSFIKFYKLNLIEYDPTYNVDVRLRIRTNTL